MKKTFLYLDKNGDGQLSKEELVEGYTAHMHSREDAQNLVEKVLDRVDNNHSGKVDYTGYYFLNLEFLLATLEINKKKSIEKLELAFKMLDIVKTFPKKEPRWFSRKK